MNIVLLIKTGFHIIAGIITYNMRPLIYMSVCHSVTYVTFFHKVHFKCICEAKLSFLARLHEVHRAIAVTPVVHVPVPVPVPVRVRVTLALKFSRSPYLDNHSSESIHTWTIDTL